MQTALPYQQLISELNQRFPFFAEYLGDMRYAIGDNVSLYFTFFSIYLKEHWQQEGLHAQLANLLQQMHAATDEATQITLHDFLLDICSSCKEHRLDLDLLMMQLPVSLQQHLSSINSYWHTAACELPRGCC